MNNKELKIEYPRTPRAGCRDIWNAYLLKNASFDKYDIPYCPTTARELPKELISIQKAKKMYEEERKRGNRNFHYHAFIHPYIDDQVFDSSKEGFWTKPKELLNIAKHFDGVITLDFSTNLDFPDPLKRWNTYKMRTLGFYTGSNGIPTINNVRWGEEETWGYSFSGLPKYSIYSIGTVASGIKQNGYSIVFEKGLRHMVKILHPKVLIIYGSDNHPIFDELRNQGIIIVTFKSDTASFYERSSNE